jgi:hypothetical protein
MAGDPDLAEYDHLRGEIDNRTTLAYGLIALQLAALGAGLSAADKLPEILLGLAMVSSFLWVFWMDHTGQIFKIAAYIALRLAPRLRGATPDALGWERFFRDLDAGAVPEWTNLARGRFPVHTTGSVHLYTGALFGVPPPAFLVAYLVSGVHGSGGGEALRWAGVAAALVLWIATILRFRVYLRMIDAIGDMIRPPGDAGTTAATPQGPSGPAA